MVTDLIDRLRAWARRYEPRSNERRLMLEAAARIEELEEAADQEVSKRLEAQAGPITAAAVEKAMGGRRLFPWQRKALGS